mmetsp:Transcript_38138/g.55958  ORF Transcript_38138/g.55958 Transcript_38138/m.55958 type:complete len:283 (-) Transcript_38138:229-1077(-)
MRKGGKGYTKYGGFRSHGEQMAALADSGVFESQRGLKSAKAEDEAIRQQTRLEATVEKRLGNLDYIGTVYGGASFWLNSVLLTRADLREAADRAAGPGRRRELFAVGLSLGRLVDRAPAPLALLRGLLQLWEERDFAALGPAKKPLAALLARPQPARLPRREPDKNFWSIEEDDKSLVSEKAIRLQRYRNEILYLEYMTPMVNIELDYFQVLISLCDQLSFVYKKLMDLPLNQNLNIYESFQKVDKKIVQFFIEPVTKELAMVASSIAADDFQEFRSGGPCC